MKQILIVIAATGIIACNNAEKTPTEETKAVSSTKASGIVNTSGYSPTYSSSFEIGDVKNAEAVLALWKDYDGGNLEPSKVHFADSVTFYTADGSVISGAKDSAVANVQHYRDMFSTVKSTVHAIFPIKSIDKDEDWVGIWGTEVSTDKKGKTDSVYLQETWRFNKEGKINLLYQHSRVAKPQKMSK
jgi:hypothetical protein